MSCRCLAAGSVATSSPRIAQRHVLMRCFAIGFVLRLIEYDTVDPAGFGCTSALVAADSTTRKLKMKLCPL